MRNENLREGLQLKILIDRSGKAKGTIYGKLSLHCAAFWNDILSCATRKQKQVNSTGINERKLRTCEIASNTSNSFTLQFTFTSPTSCTYSVMSTGRCCWVFRCSTVRCSFLLVFFFRIRITLLPNLIYFESSLGIKESCFIEKTMVIDTFALLLLLCTFK